MKFFAILSLFTIGFTFTSCHKDNGNNTNNDSSSTTHNVRYEIVSLGEEEANLDIDYVTQNGIGYGNGITNANVITTTPWKHEFTIYQPFSFLIDAEILDYYNNEISVKASIYIDDILVAEKQNNNSSYLLLYYYN